ncbi:MAG: hypothetical protein NDJ89_09595 [Oligoflexia bacterium]|nr:hypothetical protein [Oligoflexia bacterium]
MGKETKNKLIIIVVSVLLTVAGGALGIENFKAQVCGDPMAVEAVK